MVGDAGVRFALLGSVRAWRAGAELALGSPAQRLLAALLVAEEGRPLSGDAIVDRMWGEHPPARARGALRTYASRLRAVLERDRTRPELLVTVGDGYALRLPPDASDLGRFRQLVAAARNAPTREAHELLRAAESLWSGPPLHGLPGPWAERRRILLTDDRLAVREARLGHDLALGRHAEAAAELEPLCAEHPVHESLWALRIRALLGCGRPQEAKQAYTAIEAELDERLGVDPGPALTSLRAQLDAGAGGAVPSAAATTPASGPPPGQLPADTADFTGRTELADRLCRELAARPDAVLITGGPGVGRTALAVHVAHRLRGHFPDGQLHADLRASTCSPADPGEILADLLHALGIPPAGLPPSTADRADRFRAALSGRRLLLLFDDVRDAEQLRPLLPPPDGACAVLVTSDSRTLLPRAVPLDPLTPDESVLLLSRIAGAERIGAEPAEAARLAALCGHLPLALRIAGGRLAARPQWTVAHLAARLDAPRRRLPELRLGPLSVAEAFDRTLLGLPPEQAAAFRQLASAPVEDFTPAEAAGLLAVDRPTALALLQALADRSLLDSPAPDSYRCPELLRLHAGGLPSADAAADPRRTS
ncbi:AfsR/SARP family transcriptional regulator [Streptacidiphilus monticola]|uniref:BTAD domain-containing putative transcriptional regulator n=1 Tax=Streptacidiphilus monticola TaxID=2161674 RepID=A0ABW1G777_9ACTN